MFLKLIPCKPSPTPLLSSMARLLQMVVYSLWVHFLSQSPTWPPLSNPLRAPVESLLTYPHQTQLSAPSLHLAHCVFLESLSGKSFFTWSSPLSPPTLMRCLRFFGWFPFIKSTWSAQSLVSGLCFPLSTPTPYEGSLLLITEDKEIHYLQPRPLPRVAGS